MSRDSRAHWLRTGYRGYRIEDDGTLDVRSGRSSPRVIDILEDILSEPEDPRPVRVTRNRDGAYHATYVYDAGRVRRYIEDIRYIEEGIQGTTRR